MSRLLIAVVAGVNGCPNTASLYGATYGNR
jgi:hypothetical protein